MGRKLTELPTCIFILVPEPIMGGIAYMSVFHALLGTPSILPCILSLYKSQSNSLSLTVILKIIQERTTGRCEAPIWWDLASRIILVEKKRNFNFQQNHTLLSINGAMSPLYNKLGLHKLHTTTKNGLQFTGICFNGTFSTPRMVNSLVHS